MAWFTRSEHFRHHRRGWLAVSLARAWVWLLSVLGFWVLLVAAVVLFSHPIDQLKASSLWVLGTVFDMVGFSDWTWTVEIDDDHVAMASHTIRYSYWYDGDVDEVIGSLWFGVWFSAVLVFTALLAWWLGKRQGSGQFTERAQSPMTPVSLRPALGAGVLDQQESLEAPLPVLHEASEAEDQERTGRDIHRLFQEERFWEAPRERKPVAKHRWGYRRS